MYTRPELPGAYWISRAIWGAHVAFVSPSRMIPPVVMSIGVLEESRLRFGHSAPTVAYVQGSFGQIPSFGVAISAHRDALTVWPGAREQHVDPAINERVLEGMRKELAAVTRPGA